MSTGTSVRAGTPTQESGGGGQAGRGLPITGWVLRQHWRSTLGWGAALATVCAIYVSFYPAMGGDEMTELIETLPEAMVTALGYDGIGTPAGYLKSTVYGLLAPILLLIFAVGFGARVIAAEEEDGGLELELTLPASRRRVFLERTLALTLRLAVLSGVVLVTVTALVVALDMDVSLANVAAASLGLFLHVLAMGAVALATGAATGRKAFGLAAGSGVAVAGFMADALGPLVDGAGWLVHVSPFSWYLAGEPLVNGLDLSSTVGPLALTAVVLGLGLARFERRDLGV